MSDQSVRGLASIIIPCWNQLEFTRRCVAALMRQTTPRWELIVVNNGSTDGTADYLGGVQDVSPVPVTIIANGTNRGFPTGINQGLQYARGEYLVLLNNDVVVTDGWLDQLIALSAIEEKTDASEPSHSNGESLESRIDAVHSDANQFEPSETHPFPDKNIALIDLAPGNVTETSRPLKASEKIGLVGPMSNYAAPPQLV
jgi:GT2 family glycosyltransferase